VTNINARGELVLRETHVQRVVNSPEAQIIETAIAVAAGDEGGPLLDMMGRVIGMAAPARYIGIPRGWSEDAPVRPASEAAPAQATDTGKKKGADAQPREAAAVGKRLDDIKAGRDERIDKAAGGM